MQTKTITSERFPQILTPQFQQRFWSKVEKKLPHECWLWTCATNIDGYGVMSVRMSGGLVQFRAHHIAWVSTHKCFIPKNRIILHSCIATRRCCNPCHLNPGTQLENIQQMIAQGRKAPTHGEKSAQAILTNKNVFEIREMWKSGRFSQTEIARYFRITGGHVCNIVHRKAWTHI